jgi:protein-disulfide isomerase
MALHAPRRTETTPPIPGEPVSIEGAARKGSDTAPVVLVEFADYQCPACRRFETDTMPRLEAAYLSSGQVQWVLRHHPIVQLHPAAMDASRAAACAGARGRFWEMHQALFADPKRMDRSSLVRRAKALGLDEQAFATCLEDASIVAAVQRDINQATSLALLGTPAFMVGRREPDGRVRVSHIIPGAAPFADFKGAIDEALAWPVGWGVGLTAAMGVGVFGAALAIIAMWRRRTRQIPQRAPIRATTSSHSDEPSF